jgi:transcriptional regulator with XRE-family HTH domain
MHKDIKQYSTIFNDTRRDTMTVGDRIKYLRIEKGMTQEELGEKVGVKNAAINKYETGIVVNLKRDMIVKLASALDTTPAYLMGWEDEEPDDIDLMELREQLRRSPETRMLFSVTKHATPEQIKLVAEMLKQWKHASE